ncbi:hypothetical protein RR48_06477 [Papilio machaon]|uniref:Uncharacterized protein n=1 Tax=Papilio machaon TaxID=76193 RepID=A0A194RQ50_PAPMA|nr:hypothetical protein RR48_06477 [Papilio machaon]
MEMTHQGGAEAESLLRPDQRSGVVMPQGRSGQYSRNLDQVITHSPVVAGSGGPVTRFEGPGGRRAFVPVRLPNGWLVGLPTDLRRRGRGGVRKRTRSPVTMRRRNRGGFVGMLPLGERISHNSVFPGTRCMHKAFLS